MCAGFPSFVYICVLTSYSVKSNWFKILRIVMMDKKKIKHPTRYYNYYSLSATSLFQKNLPLAFCSNALRGISRRQREVLMLPWGTPCVTPHAVQITRDLGFLFVAEKCRFFFFSFKSWMFSLKREKKKKKMGSHGFPPAGWYRGWGARGC